MSQFKNILSLFVFAILFLLWFAVPLFPQPDISPIPGSDSLRVRFRLFWPEPAEKISLIGSFNQWNPDRDTLRHTTGDSLWWIEKRLPYGEYQYRFLVDGKIYLRDPGNPYFGGENSNSLLMLDPPEKPHLDWVVPLPGQRITRFPFQLKIRFLPGTRSDRVDTRQSHCTIDGVPVKLKYSRKQHLVTALVGRLSEGVHFLNVQLVDRKKQRTRIRQLVFYVDVQNEPPVVEAGYDLFCRPGEPVWLDGGLSYDPDWDEPVDIRWEVLPGSPPVQFLTRRDTLFPQVVCSDTGDYLLRLQISDGQNPAVADTVALHCRNFPRTGAYFRLNTHQLKFSEPVQSVSVAGEFNRWQSGVDNLSDPEGDGVWELHKPLPPGQYEYKFVLNNSRWIPDPANSVQVEDGWNGVNSVLTIPPFFHKSLRWSFRLTRSGIQLIVRPERSFRVLADRNNREAVPLNPGQFWQPSLVHTGTNFVYALADSESYWYSPKPFLLKNEGYGSVRLVEFDQAPGWAREAITYQIYLRRFGRDSTRTGTLKQLIRELDYLQELGVTTIWLMPIMESVAPHGYTPTNYFAVERDYGTLADFDSLIAHMHRRGMRLIFDFVANHSSDQHPFFLSAWWNPESIFRSWYQWQGEREYAFHNDWDQLPNLNYANPNVRHYILQVARFWVDRGVDGLRCDAAWGVPHSFWKDFRRQVKSWNPAVLLIDEVLPRDPAYHRLEFDMSYDTDFYGNVLDVFRGKKSVAALRFGLQKTRLNYPPTTIDLRYLENQDLPRFIAQFGEPATRAAATLLFTLPGMPLIYYGQEVGAVATRGAMRWDRTGSALFRFYRKLIALRRQHRAFSLGTLHFLPVRGSDSVLAYLRQAPGEHFLVLINFADSPATVQVPAPADLRASYLFGDVELGPGIHPYRLDTIPLNPYGFLILRLSGSGVESWNLPEEER